MAQFAEWTEELEAALAEPFPAEWVKSKKAGKGERSTSISFVPWHRYAERLNALVGGGWSMGEPVTLHVGDKLVMGLPLTILGTTRVNFGDEDDSEWEEVLNKDTGELEDKKTMYGSPCTNAFAQAFKRSCALFGIGLYLYNKGGASAKPAPSSQPVGVQHSNVPDSGVLDYEITFGKHQGKTWAWVRENDASYITFALDKLKPPKLPNEVREALKIAPESDPGTDAVLLEDALGRAAAVGAVTIEQSARIEEAIREGDTDHMRVALDWLNQQMERKKLAGSSI